MSRGEVTWQRQWVQLPALLQTLCDLICAGPSCAFSLAPQLTAASVCAWHANSAGVSSAGRKAEGAKLHFHRHRNVLCQKMEQPAAVLKTLSHLISNR